MLMSKLIKAYSDEGEFGDSVYRLIKSAGPGLKAFSSTFTEELIQELFERHQAVEDHQSEREVLIADAYQAVSGRDIQSDEAMFGEKGGIDLNPALMDLQIKRDERGVPLPMEYQEIQNIEIEGFLPVIINIAPVTNLPMLLGTGTDEPEGGEQPMATSTDQPFDLSLRED